MRRKPPHCESWKGHSHFSAAPVSLWTLNLGLRFWSRLVPCLSLSLLRLLEPERPVRTASNLLSFFTLQLQPRRKVTVSPQLIRECFFDCVFLFLLTSLLTYLTSFFFFFFLFGFFELCSFITAVHLGFSSLSPSALPVSMPLLWHGSGEEF